MLEGNDEVNLKIPPFGIQRWQWYYKSPCLMGKPGKSIWKCIITHHTHVIISMGGHSMASLVPSSSARQAVIAGEMHLLDPPGRLVNCQLQTSMDAMLLHLAVLVGFLSEPPAGILPKYCSCYLEGSVDGCCQISLHTDW